MDAAAGGQRVGGDVGGDGLVCYRGSETFVELEEKSGIGLKRLLRDERCGHDARLKCVDGLPRK